MNPGLEAAILKRVKEGVPYADIAQEFKVSRTTVSAIAVSFGLRKRKTNRRRAGRIY